MSSARAGCSPAHDDRSSGGSSDLPTKWGFAVRRDDVQQSRAASMPLSIHISCMAMLVPSRLLAREVGIRRELGEPSSTLAVVVVPWVRSPRLRPEQFLAD
jgi:hypothetical protein